VHRPCVDCAFTYSWLSKPLSVEPVADWLHGAARFRAHHHVRSNDARHPCVCGHELSVIDATARSHSKCPAPQPRRCGQRVLGLELGLKPDGWTETTSLQARRNRVLLAQDVRYRWPRTRFHLHASRAPANGAPPQSSVIVLSDHVFTEG
jgi:hypothetical protein